MSVFLIAGFFLFVLAMVSAAGYFLYTRREASEPETLEMASRIGLEADEERGLMDAAVSVFHNLGEMLPASEASRAAMRRRLNFAGYRSAAAITSYFGIKSTSAVFLAVIFCAFALQTRDDGSMIFAAAACGLGLGFLAPERILDVLIKSRNHRLRRALPPALDLMVMSLEAGQALDQALLLASRGLQSFSPDLSQELLGVYLETRASKSRADSIRNMRDRNSEPELRKFSNLLLDADRFGSSLAPTLRQHAKFLRIRFRQRAQEDARKLTVKMVFPVFFLIFPAILVVTLGPAVLIMQKYLKNLWV
ncbi:MAG: type II secretion system F family protein [Bryobacterales bacterium]|nr:type II secretion system F family protein [Bryobacterales bacterium]